MKLYGDESFTHMPFVFEGKLLHCRAQNRPRPSEGMADKESLYQAYDIYCSDLDGANPFYIGAGLGEDVIACSPNAFRDEDGTVVLNYVAVRMTAPTPQYFHFQRTGSSLESLGEHRVRPEPMGIPNYCQSENKRLSYTVFRRGERSTLVQYDKKDGRWRGFEFKSLSLLKRAVVLEEWSVVLTYLTPSGDAKSAVFDTETLELKNIKVNGNDVYKSHLHDGQAYYSVRKGGATYGMAIHRDTYALEPSDLRAGASPWA